MPEPESTVVAPPVVSLAAVPGYDDFPLLLSRLREAMQDLGGMEAFVQPGQRVLLKANLVAPTRPEQAVTTHPAVLRAVIRLVQEAGGIACVGDGPGVGDTRTAMAVGGLLAVVQEEGAEMLEFDETAVFENLSNRVGKRLSLCRHLQDCQVLISLPKLKTHVQMAFTGAVKNQFGLIPGSAKGQMHFRFQDRNRLADYLVDINRTARPALAIMDAIVGMEGPGPSGGTPRQIGALIVGSDLPAVDVVACTLIGLDPDANPLNLAARRAGYGTTRLEEIRLAGVPLADLQVHDYKLVQIPANILRILPLPASVLRWLRRQLSPRPSIDHRKCILCRRCTNGCPVNPPAIHPDAPPGQDIDEQTCIRCYCCHEFCPVKAIDLRRSRLDRCLHLNYLANKISRLLGKIVALWR
jgi:uncharacterized protein (DUF362 family)/ferredoxin